MKKIIPFLLLIAETLNLNAAFQSIVGPRNFSPYSTTFDVINPNSYPTYNFSPLYNNYNQRTIYVRSRYTPYSNTRDIQSLFIGLPGFSSSPSITLLKDIRRKIDGSSNNLNHISYNSAKTGLARHITPLYKDGKSIPMGSNVSPRETSNALGRVAEKLTLDPNNITVAFVIWGQFIDHDVGLTEVNDHESMPIKIPKCDPFMDSQCNGDKQIPFKRSIVMGGEVRDMMNSITGWVDASMVYGSSDEVANRLREFSLGRLKQGNDSMLPLQIGNAHRLNDAGDIRVNENILLTSYHTIFVREHNRIAKIIITKDPRLNDEEVYQAAKNYVTGLIQKITFEEFLPILIGKKAYGKYIGPYNSYDSQIDPTVEIEFTTAAFRFGHSMLVPKYPLIDLYGEIKQEISLNEMFFRPNLLNSTSMNMVLKGLSRTIAKKRDGTIISEVRNLLITDPDLRHINMDLYALNVQRARDHGLQKFNYMRMAYGFGPLKSFEQLTGQRTRAKELQEFYKDINEVDPWVGILNEKSLQDGVLGEVGAKIVAQNFNKLRNGDRFWYEKDFPFSVMSEIRSTKLSEVIIRNTGVLDLQEDIFHYSSS